MSTLTLSGTVDPAVAALFVEQLSQASPEAGPLSINLRDADIEHADVVATLTEALRETAKRLGSLQVIAPPQVLAHCLYRVGSLGQGSTLHIVEPRQDLPTSS